MSPRKIKKAVVARPKLPAKLRFEITQEDIDGSDDSCTNCSIARAIKRTFGLTDVRVYGPRITIKLAGCTYKYSNTVRMQQVQVANDLKQQVLPGVAIVNRLSGSAGFGRTQGLKPQRKANIRARRSEREEAAGTIKVIDDMICTMPGILSKKQLNDMLTKRAECETRLQYAPRTLNLAKGIVTSHRGRTSSLRDVLPA